jgi:hypothetical protein
LGKFWRVLQLNMLVYFMSIWYILFFHIYCMIIWYIFHVLVCCTKKNFCLYVSTRARGMVGRPGPDRGLKAIASLFQVTRATPAWAAATARTTATTTTRAAKRIPKSAASSPKWPPTFLEHGYFNI